MTILEDKNTNLIWQKYSQEILNFEHEKFISKINNWTYSKNIQEFISNDCCVGEFFRELSYDKGIDMYFCIDDDTLVGVTLISVPTSVKVGESNIEYIVVNPNLQTQGYGSKMIKSIINNNDYFTLPNIHRNWIAYVKHSNIPSQKAFLKNNFQVFQKINSQSSYLKLVYTLAPHQKTQEKDENSILL